jgi:pre-mRNA-processing factor 17
MSLALGYSSGEDEDPAIFAKDAFGISSLPSVKKPRVDESASRMTAEAAPHVLSEVSQLVYFHRTCAHET